MASDYTGAIILVVLSYMLPLFIKPLRAVNNGIGALYLVITVQHSISIINYFIFPLPGADLDASTFSYIARSYAIQMTLPDMAIGTSAYEFILFVLYSNFGPSKFVGQSFSILVTVLSSLYIIKIARNLELSDKYIAILILVFGFTPSFLFYTSLTFREVFQLFGLVAGIYYAQEAFKQRSLSKLLASSVFYIFMGIFHQVLLALSFALILVTCFFYFLHSNADKKIVIRNMLLSMIAILSAGYVMVVNIPVTDGNDYLKSLIQRGGVVEMVGYYRKSIEGIKPRSEYGFEVQSDSITDLAIGLSRSYLYYLYGPWVFSAEKAIDLVAGVNALGRLLVTLLLFYLVLKKSHWPDGFAYLLVVFFTVSGMWSIGTTNFGQAFRHNSLTDWILAVVLLICIQLLASQTNQARTQT